MSYTITQVELGKKAVDILKAMLDAELITPQTHEVFGPAIKKLVTEYEAARPVIHIRQPYARWPKDDIPACDNDGDTPNDLYTNDRRKVTCVDCLRVLDGERE